MSGKPLSALDLEERLERYLDPVLSSRRTAEAPAQLLSAFSREQQDFVLHWVSVIVKTNSEMGYQFAVQASNALRLMDLDGIEQWIIHAMDVYDKQGLYPGSAALQGVEPYAGELRERSIGTCFDDVSGILERFVWGLSGRQLELTVSDHVYTDTEQLYLPPRLAVFATRQDNFRLYKAMVGHLWAQTWYGTFRRLGSDMGSLNDVLGRYHLPDRACRMFHTLETVRLNACIERDLPGLHREMMTLQRQLGEISYPSNWAPVLEQLERPGATVQDSCQALMRLYAVSDEIARPYCFQGQLLLSQTEAAMRSRQSREQQELRLALRQLAEEVGDLPAGDERRRPFRFDVKGRRQDEWIGEFRVELTLNDAPIAPPENVRTLIVSMLQDLGEIPDEHLVPAGDGAYRSGSELKQHAEDVWQGTYHEEGAFLYNEWDFRRQHYRKDWCVLREIDVHPSDQPFVTQTLKRHSGLVAELRKTFEALRGEDRLLKRQMDGDDIDLDAVVEAYADMRVGMEMSERVFTKLKKLERNMAVIFMVDMSGSTKGWINDAERESLVLLCEALEILGDRYAIFGFSGMTRKRCELYRIKRFDEHYNDMVKRRITGIKPQDYTRMGVIIRHLTRLLRDVEARTKLLVTLSDGKPDDYDGYRGEYGIEDTRKALIEAKHEGIHPFCITIDSEAKDYLPRMYGAVNYVVIDKVRQLPLKVSDIYRRLTT